MGEMAPTIPSNGERDVMDIAQGRMNSYLNFPEPTTRMVVIDLSGACKFISQKGETNMAATERAVVWMVVGITKVSKNDRDEGKEPELAFDSVAVIADNDGMAIAKALDKVQMKPDGIEVFARPFC